MDGLLTLLFYALIFYFMMRFGCGAHMTHGHHGAKSDDKSDDKSVQTVVFVDPVCGNKVQEDQGYGELVDGHLFRFCSKECLNTFDENITEYSKKPNKFITQKDHHHEA